MFKKRLKIVLEKTLHALLFTFFACIAVGILSVIGVLMLDLSLTYPMVATVALIIIVCTTCASAFWYFVNWLFLEPYFNSRKKKEQDESKEL